MPEENITCFPFATENIPTTGSIVSVGDSGVSGSSGSSGACTASSAAFRAASAVTRAEAAAIADRSLALADDGRGLTFADSDTVPVWAAQSVVNCSALGMLPVREDNTICADEMLTRADAAVMLYEMLKFRAE